MSDTKDKTIKVEKKQKSLTVAIYSKTQPIRDCVSNIVLDENSTPDELAHVQGELRRLSRLIKKTRKKQDQ